MDLPLLKHFELTLDLFRKFLTTIHLTNALPLLVLRGWRTPGIRRRLTSVAWGHIN